MLLRQPVPLHHPNTPRALRLQSANPAVRRIMAVCLVLARDPTLAHFCTTSILIDSHEWVNGPMDEENAGVKLLCVLIHTLNNIDSLTLEASVLAQFERLSKLVVSPTIVGLYEFFLPQLELILAKQAPNLFVVSDWLKTLFRVKRQKLCGCHRVFEVETHRPEVVKLSEVYHNRPFTEHFTCMSGVRESEEICVKEDTHTKYCNQAKVEINKPTKIPLVIYMLMQRLSPCTVTYELDEVVPLGAVYGSVDTADYELGAIASETNVWLRKDVDTWFKFDLLEGTVDEMAQDNIKRSDATCELFMLLRTD